MCIVDFFTGTYYIYCDKFSFRRKVEKSRNKINNKNVLKLI